MDILFAMWLGVVSIEAVDCHWENWGPGSGIEVIMDRPSLGMTDRDIESELAQRCCKRCYGRGFTGWDLKFKPILCQCVIRAKKVVPLAAVEVEHS
jgi:hypothetical protein